MMLFRPTGERELALIAQSGYTAFPPRLPGQPIFYPVLNQTYAEQIATKWNKRTDDDVAYVVSFEIDDDYIRSYPVQTVGGKIHQEYWIPAEELETFNKHIIGKIEIIAKF